MLFVTLLWYNGNNYAIYLLNYQFTEDNMKNKKFRIYFAYHLYLFYFTVDNRQPFVK